MKMPKDTPEAKKERAAVYSEQFKLTVQLASRKDQRIIMPSETILNLVGLFVDDTVEETNLILSNTIIKELAKGRYNGKS